MKLSINIQFKEDDETVLLIQFNNQTQEVCYDEKAAVFQFDHTGTYELKIRQKETTKKANY